MRQVFDFSFSIGRIKLPKYCLYDKQAKTATQPARYMWVEDPRAALRQHFVVTFYDLQSGWTRQAYLDSRVSSIARRFHEFALSLPEDMLQAPIRVMTNKQIDACGPRDRYVPEPMQKGVYTRPYKVSGPVTENCKIGHVRVRQEGYNELKLGMKFSVR